MDIFAHVLWTNAVYYAKYANQRRQRYIAALFGVLPDLASFVPLTGYLLYQRLFQHTAVGVTPEDMDLFTSRGALYSYAVNSYNFTHSLVIFAVAVLLVVLVRRGKLYWPMLGWGLHIVIDFFTHKDFFPTPIFFPLSSYRNPFGISWAEPIFMLVNYLAVVVVYVFIVRYRRRARAAQTSATLPPQTPSQL